ncbi:MAG: rhodanese-like domain-containing protein [Acidobacteriota bacterium]
MKKPLIQAVILILASFVLAIASNALASRQRKVTLVGWYPNATKVPVRAESVQPRVVAAAPGRQPVAPVVPAPAPTSTAGAAVATQTQAPVPVPQPSNPATQTTPQPRNPATPQPPPPDVLARFQNHPDKPYIEIAYDDVAALHGKGVLFLDARRTSVYEQGHIAGARPFSVWESDIDEKTRKLFDERSDPAAQALPIVIYCSGGDCEDSHMLAEKLWGIQFNNVYVYKDGFPDWQKRGGAVRSGAQP